MFKKVIDPIKEKDRELLEKSRPLGNKDFMIFGDFKPLIIEENSELISESLGISDERRLVLNKLIEDNYYIPKVSSLLMKCVQEAVHPNEVAYIALTIGRRLDK